LAVGNRGKDFFAEPLTQQESSLLFAGGAHPPLAAGMGYKKFFSAIGTTYSGETLFEVATLEELVY